MIKSLSFNNSFSYYSRFKTRFKPKKSLNKNPCIRCKNRNYLRACVRCPNAKTRFKK
jgi:hypothetical protein